MPPLRGFTRPFAPHGGASLAPALPYDASMTGMLVHFRADPVALAALLPPPLEPHPTRADEAFWVYIDHLMTPADGSVEEWHPDRVRMHEVLIGIPCVLRGSPGIFNCFAWTDRDWSLMTEWLFGWCGKIARLSMTHTQPEHPRFSGPVAGAHYRATVERLGARVAAATVVLEGPVEEAALPLNELLYSFGERHIPNVDIRAEGRPLVHDLIKEHHDSTVVGPIWRGRATLTFHDAENEELVPIQPTATIAGYLMRFGYRVTGVEVVHDYLAPDGPGPRRSSAGRPGSGVSLNSRVSRNSQ